MTYEEVVEMGLKLPEVEEALYFRSPSLKRNGRFMLGERKTGELISVKLDWDTHDRLLEENPEVIYKTDHYEGWPGFLVRLECLEPSLAQELLDAAWNNAPLPAKRRLK